MLQRPEYETLKDFRVIAISGKAEHGKDSAFKCLCKANAESGCPYIVRQIAFGDYVKQCASFMGWDGDKINNRKPLTDIGQYGRNMDEEVWVKHAYADMIRIMEEYRLGSLRQRVLFVITDLRFKAELRALERDFAENLFTIRVYRPGHVSNLSSEQLADISEVDLDDVFDFDFFVSNTTIAALQEAISNIFDEVTLYYENVK